IIPAFCVDAVCEVPFGSYPGNMPGEYYSDEEHLRLWLEVEKDEAEFRKLLAALRGNEPNQRTARPGVTGATTRHSRNQHVGPNPSTDGFGPGASAARPYYRRTRHG